MYSFVFSTFVSVVELPFLAVPLSLIQCITSQLFKEMSYQGGEITKTYFRSHLMNLFCIFLQLLLFNNGGWAGKYISYIYCNPRDDSKPIGRHYAQFCVKFVYSESKSISYCLPVLWPKHPSKTMGALQSLTISYLFNNPV